MKYGTLQCKTCRIWSVTPFCILCNRVWGRVEMLRKRNPELCEGWIIVKNKSELVKKARNLSTEKLKKKMEEGIEEAVRQSMLEMPVLEEFESGGDKEYEGQEDPGKIKIRKRKLIQAAQSKKKKQWLPQGGWRKKDAEGFVQIGNDPRYAEVSPSRGRRRKYQGEHSRGDSCEVFGRLVYGE